MARDLTKYKVDGKRVPSVTEILDEAGFTDLSMIPEAVLEQARFRGQEVHGFLKVAAEDPCPEGMSDVYGATELVKPYVRAWERWKKDTGFVIEQVEQVVVSKIHRYAGTYDLLGTLRGTRCLVDYKCRYGLTPEIGPQLAGYRQGIRESDTADRLGLVQRFALLLKPNGTYLFEEYTDRNDLHAFLAANHTLHWRLNHKLVTLDQIRSRRA